MEMLIIGGSGLIGSSVHDLLSPEINITRTYNNNLIQGCIRYQAGKDSLEKLYLTANKPDTILFSAGSHANVNGAANNICNAIETTLNEVLKISRFCNEKDINLIFISSDAVYGEVIASKHRETSICSPKSEYGAIRLLCEKIIQACCKRYLIIRMGRFITDASYGAGFLYELATSKGDLTLASDNSFTPTVNIDLSMFLRKALQDNLNGVYNIGSLESISSYDLCKHLIMYNPQLNKKITETDFDLIYDKTKHVKNSVMDLSKINTETNLSKTPIEEKLAKLSVTIGKPFG